MQPLVGEALPPSCATISVPEIEKRVRATVERTELAEYNAVIDGAEQELAKAEVEAAAAISLDNHSITGKCTLAALAAADATVERLRLIPPAIREAIDETRERITTLPPGFTRREYLICVATTLAIGIISILATAQVLAPALDAFVLRGYYQSVYQGDVAPLSLRAGQVLGHMIAATLLGSFAALIIATGGRVSRKLKFSVTFFEIIFSVSFAVLRTTGNSITLQSVAWTGFEFVIVAAGSLFLSGIAGHMARRSAAAETRAALQAEIVERQKWLAEKEAELRQAENFRARQLAVIQAREEADVQKARNIALVEATVHAAVVSEVEATRAGAERALHEPKSRPSSRIIEK